MKNKIVLFGFLLAVFSNLTFAQTASNYWFKRVMITNDNGIDDYKTKELAKAFAKVTETYVSASLEDKSGVSHSVTLKRKYKVEKRNLGEGITAYGVDGTPAESVIFGLQGLLRDKQPDLVISGVNGGENAGMEWLFSGTIGAARMSTVMGVPAIAVSGLSSKHPQNFSLVVNWVIDFANSKLARELKPGQYVTVSFPRVPFNEIKGVEVAHRAFIPMGIKGKNFEEPKDSDKGEWEFESYTYKEKLPAGSDHALYLENKIVIVVMQADENDYKGIEEFKTRISEIPKFDSSKK